MKSRLQTLTAASTAQRRGRREVTWLIVLLAVYHAIWFYMYVCKKLFVIKNKLWIEPVFAWYDFWIGLFWKKTPHLWYHIYLFFLPMIGFSVKIRKPSRKLGKKRWLDFLEMSDWEREEMEAMYRDD